MPTTTLNDLFIRALSDVYSAEKQLTKALPKLAMNIPRQSKQEFHGKKNTNSTAK